MFLHCTPEYHQQLSPATDNTRILIRLVNQVEIYLVKTPGSTLTSAYVVCEDIPKYEGGLQLKACKNIALGITCYHNYKCTVNHIWR